MIVSPYQQPFRGLQINRTHPLARKLIGYWPFNDGTGKKVWDYSDNANQGTLEGGATWAPGRRGWAVNCDGTNGRIDCGNGAPLDDIGNGSFWFSFRMKSKDTVPNNYGMLLAKPQNDIFDAFWLSSYGVVNRLNFFFKKGDVGVNNTQFSINTAPFDAIWNHIVLVINRFTDKALVYMNTVKDSTEIDISSVPADGSNTGNLLWGKRLTGLYYEGLIGNCLVGKGILSQEEINWLYREPYAMFMPWLRRFYPIYEVIEVTGQLTKTVEVSGQLTKTVEVSGQLRN